MKFSWTGENSVSSSYSSLLIRACKERCTLTWTQVYLSWNYTGCTYQISYLKPCLQGWWELVCKVHWVQFQTQCIQGGSQVPWCQALESSYLANLRVDIGMSWSKFFPFSGVLHTSTQTVKSTREGKSLASYIQN